MSKHILILLVLFLSQPLNACTVCFGGANSDMIRGFTWGVGILLALPFLLLGGLSGLIVYNARKNKRHVQIRP